MDPVVAYAIVGGIVALSIGGALCLWLSNRGETEKRRLEHEERMKALELGQVVPIPDLSKAAAQDNEAFTIGCLGILVPLGLVSAAVGATGLIFQNVEEMSERVIFISIVWGVCGLVSLAAVLLSLLTLKTRSGRTPQEMQDDDSGAYGGNRSVEVRERPFRE
jgi:H+/gluconate symporter-like permease